MGWGNLTQSFIGNALIYASTFRIPKNQDVQNLARWYIQNGETGRQINYFLIQKEQRNWIINIKNDTNATP